MTKMLCTLILFVSLYSNCVAMTSSQRTSILNLHNAIRAQFSLPSLIWDTKIEKQAQDWANTLVKKNLFAHSTSLSRSGMGENIYMMTSYGQKINLDGSDAIATWLSEQDSYDYPSNICNHGSVCGHFTQMIWRNTKKIGCGQSKQKKGKITTVYWVCQYDPPGNYIGQKPY